MVKWRWAGIGGGRSALRLGSGMVRSFDHCLQFLACMERHNASRGDGNFFAGLGIAPRALRFLSELEVAEAGQLHAVTGFQSDADFLEKPLDHVLGFTLVEAELLE